MTVLAILGRAFRPAFRTCFRRLNWLVPIWRLFSTVFIGSTATVRTDGLTVSVPASDGVGLCLVTGGSYEPFKMEAFKRSITPGMIVVDVGAHIGLYTLAASSRAGPEGKVYAFEPVPSNYDLLVQNIKANGLSNVTPVQKAVLDKPGTVTMYVHPKESALHSVRRLGQEAKEIIVGAISLDEFFASQRVDIVKIDVEGADMPVLQGMQRLISENPEIKLFWEFVPRFLTEAGADPRDFLAKVLAHGFTIYKLDDWRREIGPVADVPGLLAENGCELVCIRRGTTPPFVP